MQLGDLVGPLQDELPSGSNYDTMSISLTCISGYREIQKSGRKSAGARSKPSVSTAATDPPGSMGPPQSIPKKGKGAAVIAPMSEEEAHTQGQPADSNMDVDAEMDDVENGEEADVNESSGEEEETGEEEEEEDEELADQMAMEDEEVRRDIKGLDLPNQPADGDEDA